MTPATYRALATTFLVAASATMIASCGIEAAEQTAAETAPQTAAEQLADRFSQPKADKTATGQPQPPANATAQEADPAGKALAEAKRVAAAKRAEEKQRKAAAALLAGKVAQQASEQAKADEIEMLAQARAEAEQRRAAIETGEKDQDKADAAALIIAQAKVAAEAEAARLDNARAATERAAILAVAKAAEAQKRVDDLRVAEERRLAEEQIVADAKKQAFEREQANEEQRQGEAKALEAKREAGARLLAERLRAAEIAREAKAAAAAELARPTAPVPATTGIESATATVALPRPVDPLELPSKQFNSSQRVTILIVMVPGSKGIRRFEKSADPVLCVKDGCYVSAGASAPARLSPRPKVLGAANTFGDRAGACKHTLGCAFRDIDVAASGGYVQPVDMKVLVHDRREAHVITGDSDCDLENARIVCRRPTVTTGYRMWIVPEALATKAGQAALESAVQNGLPSSGQSAVLTR